MSVTESDIKISDELAGLMSRNLHLESMPVQHDLSTPPTPQVIPMATPIAYITQHYHHSTHQAASPTQSVSSVLKQAGVDATALLPSQLHLFRDGTLEQQQRLIELWKAAPPTYGNQMLGKYMNSDWPQTSMKQEEEAARQRWERSEQERLRNLCMLSPSQNGSGQAEPYMDGGYQNLPNVNGMTAPTEYGSKSVNDKSRGWWHLSDEEPMEHQYGMIQHLQMYGLPSGDDDEEML